MTDVQDTTSAAPSQPGNSQPYYTSGNPTDQKPNESRSSDQNAQANALSEPVEKRGPNDVSGEEPALTSRARGVHGAPAGLETKGKTQDDVDSEALDAAQMAAPGEGKISSVVDEKPGASGAQPGFETDLDAKKEEQAEARKAQHSRTDGAAPEPVNVGKALGEIEQADAADSKP